MKFNQESVVERVEAAYAGYGATKKLKGATVTATFLSIDTDEDGVQTEQEFKFTLEVPKGSSAYPGVGDKISITIE